MAEKRISYDNVKTSDLFVDAIYCSPRPSRGGYSDDVLTVMLHNCRNTGGFRVSHRKDRSIPYIGLHLCDFEPAWPDRFDVETGVLTYYGDNRKGGNVVEDTPIGGNKILHKMFDDLSKGGEALKDIPPIFVFQNTGEKRDVRFLGLAVPGIKDIHEDDYFDTVWRTINNVRFPNYVAKFTILDLDGDCIKREWLETMINDPDKSDQYMPKAWKNFLENGLKGVKALAAPVVVDYPGKNPQLPNDEEGKKILIEIQSRYGKNPSGFEKLCVMLMYMMDPNYRNIRPTRPVKDGGRDAVADYIISSPTSSVVVECAMEAKCYNPYATGSGNSVGVHETARLISRIKNRQFGVMMTTSYIDKTTYTEIKEDGHPILFCTGKDIVEILQEKANVTSRTIGEWLDKNVDEI